MCYIQKQILEKPNPSLSFPIFLMMLDPLRCSDDFCALIFFTLPILYFKIIKNFGHFFIIYNYYHLKNHPPCPNEMTIPQKKKTSVFSEICFFFPQPKNKNNLHFFHKCRRWHNRWCWRRRRRLNKRFLRQQQVDCMFFFVKEKNGETRGEN